MKHVLMLAVSAALTLVPAAHAQISCAEANDLTDLAYEDFDSITGEHLDDGTYQSTFTLAGAAGCQILLDYSISYACMWSYADAATAQDQFNIQANALGACFSDWDRAPYTSHSGQAGVTTISGQSFFAFDDDGGEFTWIAYVEEHNASDVHDWHVWVGIDYF